MIDYFKQIEIRWSDLDPNFHLRHSAYYDFGAYCRISFMNEHGLTPQVMMHNHIGPVIFREECVFKKEIKFGDVVKINVMIEKATQDFSKWTMTHEVWKNEVLSAVITVDGAWIDTVKRKLTVPPDMFKGIFAIITKDKSESIQ
jgi:acyl-CoA thioester hydrolase